MELKRLKTVIKTKMMMMSTMKLVMKIVVTRRVPVQRAVERDEIPYPYDATMRPLLNIMDSASHNPALCCPLS